MNIYTPLATCSSIVPSGTRLLGAYRETPPGAPILGYADLVDLRVALEKIHEGTLEGEGFYIESYPVNTRLRLLAETP